MSTICAIDIDDDRFRISEISILSQPLQPAIVGVTPASSISRAVGEVSLSRSRPQLELPRTHYMIDLLDLHSKIEATVAKELTLFRAQSKADLAEIERLEKEKDEALRKNAADAALRNNWTVLGNVAQYLATGTSIAAGLSLGPSYFGALLIASGVAGLGSRLVRDTAGWQTVAAWFTKSVENQKRLAHQIEMGILAVELGTGLAGGLGACFNGAFSAMANTPKLISARKMAAVIQAVSSSVHATARLGKTFIDKRESDLIARMKILDAHAERIRMEMSQQASDARSMIDTVQAFSKEMHKAINASELDL